MEYKYKGRENEYKREWRRDHPEYYKERLPLTRRYNRDWYSKNREARNAYNKLYQDRDKRRANDLRKKYKMTVEDLETMLLSQDYKCKLCGKPLVEAKQIHIDHNHKTGKVRGVLCGKCNTKLGHVEDQDFLQKALEYLNNNNKEDV